MPVGTEALFLEAADGALGQVTVLEAAAGEDDAGLADLAGDGNDGLDEGVVEPGGDRAVGTPRLQVGKKGFDHRRPIEEEWCVLRVACCVLGVNGEA